MNAPIPVSEALRLLSMALEDCDKADAKQAGCAGRHRGPCGEGLHHHHDENCFPDLLARATMRPLLELLRQRIGYGFGVREEIYQSDGVYPPLAALRDHYDQTRPDWRTK